MQSRRFEYPPLPFSFCSRCGELQHLASVLIAHFGMPCAFIFQHELIILSAKPCRYTTTCYSTSNAFAGHLIFALPTSRCIRRRNYDQALGLTFSLFPSSVKPGSPTPQSTHPCVNGGAVRWALLVYQSLDFFFPIHTPYEEDTNGCCLVASMFLLPLFLRNDQSDRSTGFPNAGLRMVGLSAPCH